MSTVVRAATGDFKKTTLKNGLRVLTEHLPAVRSVSLGVWIDVGSRNEATLENGVSHLIEHMLFKGTKRRTAKQIAMSLESLGGALNGWTSREHTCYTARILDEHIVEAVDVLADLACNPSMTPHNLSREKLVICEEIKETIDTPSDRIHDVFSRAYWGDHALGNPIMGSQDNIMNMTRARMMSFYQRHYQAGSIVVAASGSVSHDKLVRLAREKFSFPQGMAEIAPRAERTQVKRLEIVPDEGAQTHFCLGVPGIAYGDLGRMAVQVLNTYLGGGMSSVLFQKIREEKGLAYTVYTFHDFYRDGGVFGTYMGTDGRQLPQAFDIVRQEFRKTKRTRLTAIRLDQIKAQLKGQVILALESTYNRMSRIARLEMMYGKYITLSDTLKMIDEVTANDVLEQANRLFDESQMTVAVLGPVDKDVLKDVA
jgi:predicted Zn-dependent peptidase